MAENKEQNVHPLIERMSPENVEQGMRLQATLDNVSAEVAPQQQMVELADYLKNIAEKPRGVSGNNSQDLNSHFETYIVEDEGEVQVVSLADLQEKLAAAGLKTQILGVNTVGNKNQMVSNMVQGFNPDNPSSGYERPVVAEGAHMILAPYAIDSEGTMHVFRTLQFRTGGAVVDTPRGFAGQKELEDGTQMYDIEGAGENVQKNMQRVLKEEGGKRFLKINRIVYLGAPRVNSSFVTSQSALFGVEVDYDNFTQSTKVVTAEELERQREQFEHEGLTSIVLDMTEEEYVEYKRDSHLPRDMAADEPSDIVIMDHLFSRMEKYQSLNNVLFERAQNVVEALRMMKKSDPKAYEVFIQSYHKVKAEKSVPEKA